MRLSKEIKAAFFVLSTILLFIFGFNYLKGSSILDKQKTIYAVYDEVDGLLVGANVMINGLSIGNVTELDFLPNSTKIIVTLKNGVLDPQGKAIQQTLNGIAFDNVSEVRQGKYFDIEVNEADESKAKSQVEEMCKKLLANLVIEDYKIL